MRTKRILPLASRDTIGAFRIQWWRAVERRTMKHDYSVFCLDDNNDNDDDRNEDDNDTNDERF